MTRRVWALQAWDSARAGARQCDIAVAVFGSRMVTAESFDSMRKRVNRLLLNADQQIAEVWQRFIPKGGPSSVDR